MADEQKTMSKDRARYEFKRKLEDLRGVRGTATQLISLYVPPDRQIHEVQAQIRSEISQAQNIKSKATMKNVTAALESVSQRLKLFKQPPENGLVLFVGHKAVGGNQTKMVQHVVIPPQPITLYKYHCDSTFYLEPLEAQLKEHNNFGLIVLDRQEATIGYLRGQAVQVVTNMQSLVPNKHAKGGQSARRMERLTEEIADKWFQKIGETANEIFMGDLEKGELKGILIGGPGPTKEYWMEGGYLHHELAKKVIGSTVDTGYTDEYGLKDLVANAHNLLQDLGLTEEKDILQRFLRELAKPDNGLGAYGEEEVRNMIQIGAVETLLLSEKLRKVRVDVKCTACGHTYEATTKDVNRFERDLDHCPQCNNQTLEVVETTDVVEELSQMTEDMGGGVRIISPGSDEGELLYAAFGGIAALLRFRP